jgi:murein DD-endopeptidase MepM/ murein hydrolase activator NlpD
MGWSGSRFFTFLYMPADHSRVREVRVSRSAVLLSLAGLCLVCLMAGMYLFGIWHGSSWLPGGSVLVRENARLVTEIGCLEQQISQLRGELTDVYRLQNMVKAAVGLDMLPLNGLEAGIGGRLPLSVPTELSGLASQDRLERLQDELDRLLARARLQHAGYTAILDTLSARQDDRDHLPSIRPVDIGWLSSGYGKRPDPFTGKLTYHHGLDFSVPTGTPVRATADGVVSAVKHERGFGRAVVISHGDRIETLYAHLSHILVKKGQQVSRGQVIAESGQSGRVTAPHLHYEVRVAHRSVNPLPFILDSYALR